MTAKKTKPRRFRVPQYAPSSPEARALRLRDMTPPWSIHVCEVDAYAWVQPDEQFMGAFYLEVQRVRALRDALEADDDDVGDDDHGPV